MALNKPQLASEIEAFIRDMAELGAVPYPMLKQFSEGLANVFIDHFKANVELDNAKFSGAYVGTINTGTNTCNINIVDQVVTGGIK